MSRRDHGQPPRGRRADAGPRPDPHAPLVIDTRDLPRRPGSSRQLRREVPAPDHLGNALFAVEPGSPIRLELLLESVVEGVLVTADVTATVSGDCGYCLEPDSREVQVSVQELFSYEPPEGSEPDGRPIDDEAVGLLVDDLADLEPAVRDAVVLTLPFSRLCDDECPRLAAVLEDVTPEEERVDPRWEALKRAVADGDA
ncbi:MAG TPA: YceD family protein [Mycobacteriales bacterium]|nr:YceD family protein [Mycobacteriales bacterium]